MGMGVGKSTSMLILKVSSFSQDSCVRRLRAKTPQLHCFPIGRKSHVRIALQMKKWEESQQITGKQGDLGRGGQRTSHAHSLWEITPQEVIIMFLFPEVESN